MTRGQREVWDQPGRCETEAARLITQRRQALYRKLAASQPLTALSQTGGLPLDLGVIIGLPMDPDLHGGTRPDSPDTRHENTDQKVGQSPTIIGRRG